VLILTSTSDVVQIVSGAASSIALSVHAAWVDDYQGPPIAFSPGRQDTLITTATTTTVCPGPAASTQRNLKTLSIRNTGSTVTDVVSVQHSDGTTVVTLAKVTLPAGYTLTWRDDAGWLLTNALGQAVWASASVAHEVAAGATLALVRASYSLVVYDPTGAPAILQFPATPAPGDIVECVPASPSSPSTPPAWSGGAKLTPQGGAVIADPANPGAFSSASVSPLPWQSTRYFYESAKTRWLLLS
jgi:hypothetical protein